MRNRSDVCQLHVPDDPMHQSTPVIVSHRKRSLQARERITAVACRPGDNEFLVSCPGWRERRSLRHRPQWL